MFGIYRLEPPPSYDEYQFVALVQDALADVTYATRGGSFIEGAQLWQSESHFLWILTGSWKDLHDLVERAIDRIAASGGSATHAGDFEDVGRWVRKDSGFVRHLNHGEAQRSQH